VKPLDLADYAMSLDSLARALRLRVCEADRWRIADRLNEIAASLRRPLELAGNQPARKEP